MFFFMAQQPKSDPGRLTVEASVGFEPAIAATYGFRTYALNRTATEFGKDNTQI